MKINIHVLTVGCAVCSALALPPPPSDDIDALTKHAKELGEILTGKTTHVWESGKFQGDIIENYEQVKAEFGEQVANEAKENGELQDDESPNNNDNKSKLRGLGATTTIKSKLWPDGKIYWVWSEEVHKNILSRIAINLAHATFNSKTKLQMVYGKGNGNYIEFVRKEGCWSPVGMVGGRQEISIGSGCETVSTVLHEVLHAAGMHHEQASQDRDDYVKIHLENVESGKAHNFNKEASTSTYGFHFDYSSVMMYGEYAFSKNGKKTIDCLGHLCGLQLGLSESDIKSINYLYGKENYLDDGTKCSLFSTCKSCKNFATWWSSKSSFACGTQECWKPNTLCHTLSCKFHCCRGYHTKWYWAGFGRCN